jgi:hypothetical protein
LSTPKLWLSTPKAWLSTPKLWLSTPKPCHYIAMKYLNSNMFNLNSNWYE